MLASVTDFDFDAITGIGSLTGASSTDAGSTASSTDTTESTDASIYDATLTYASGSATYSPASGNAISIGTAPASYATGFLFRS